LDQVLDEAQSFLRKGLKLFASNIYLIKHSY